MVANMLTQALERHRRDEELRELNATLEQRVAERTGLMKLLQGVAVASNEAQAVEAALGQALRRVCEFTGWAAGTAFVVGHEGKELVPTGVWHAPGGSLGPLQRAVAGHHFESGEGVPGRVLERPGPQWSNDLPAEPTAACQTAAEAGLRAAAAFPVLSGRELTHVLEFFSAAPIDPDPGLLEAMHLVGAQLGRVVERQRYKAQLAEVAWAEQRRLGQELHDSLGQELTGLGLIAKALQGRLRATQSPEEPRASQLVTGLQQVTGQVREIARSLFPSDLGAEGLVAALRELVQRARERHGIACELEIEEPLALHDGAAVPHLYQIAKEALANALKHAAASRVVVRLRGDDEGVRLEVRDNGKGIGPAPSGGLGLKIMRSRSAHIGATLEAAPAAGGGTAVVCTLNWRNGG
jgi:signal transduction histidine kinase